MADQEKRDMTGQVQKPFSEAQDRTNKSLNTWNELLTASTDMAFDVVLKNWNYSRSLRGSAEQAVEDAIKTQHRYTSEMMQVWQGYTNNVRNIVNNAVETVMDANTPDQSPTTNDTNGTVAPEAVESRSPKTETE